MKNLRDILLEMFQNTEFDIESSVSTLPDKAIEQAKADILKWVREQLPEKKEVHKPQFYSQEHFGYNQAIDDIAEKFK